MFHNPIAQLVILLFYKYFNFYYITMFNIFTNILYITKKLQYFRRSYYHKYVYVYFVRLRSTLLQYNLECRTELAKNRKKSLLTLYIKYYLYYSSYFLILVESEINFFWKYVNLRTRYSMCSTFI